jgi:hypothetical protein
MSTNQPTNQLGGGNAKKKGDFEFAVSAGDKTIRVQAKNAEEGNSWISAINAAHQQRSASAAAKVGQNQNSQNREATQSMKSLMIAPGRIGVP